MSTASKINLTLRGIMEFGIIAALAYWGYQTGSNSLGKTLLAIAAPVLLFGMWGIVDFRKVGNFAEPLRLIEELIISGLAAIALYSVGPHILGWTLGIISILHHSLVYIIGERLLK